MEKYSKRFIRFNWITLVLIYLVVIAGSFVRITGSGMGCPDWPKCFGQWVPPTEKSQLPIDYKEVYSQKRAKKTDNFTKLLDALGMNKVSEQIRNDETILIEETFNARKTWTEYGNRLVGFLAGNAVLIVFIWILLFYRKKTLVLLSFLNLIFIGFQAWFGSIVVATNLVPWTITIHLFFALVIIFVQLLIIRKVSPSQIKNLKISSTLKLVLAICFIVTFFQMFLGTQVREYIDELTKQGYGRESWTEMLGLSFFIHRSFSWMVLILMTFVTWKNESLYKLKLIRWSYIILGIELVSGVLLAYANMPGLVQTSHLIFATVLFGILSMGVLRLSPREN